jgi:hypothetical protein
VPQDTRAAVLELRYIEIESKERRLGGFALRDLRLSLAEASEAPAP